MILTRFREHSLSKSFPEATSRDRDVLFFYYMELGSHSDMIKSTCIGKV